MPQAVEPPVPPDRLELVVGDAQSVEDMNTRQELVNLVAGARQHSNVRAQPYDLKTTFNASGSGTFDGNWQLQDTSPGRNVYRWTAEGPGYSAANLFLNNIFYTNRPSDTIPMRLAQVRAALFFNQPSLGPRASIRKSSGVLDGVELTCVLVMQNLRGRTVLGGRSWDEAEYCIDPKLNAIVVYSPIPGLYIHYEYSNAIQFHKALIPARFTVIQASQPIIEAQIASVTEPPADLSSFQPSGLNPMGVGPSMSPPWHYHASVPQPAANRTDVSPSVVVHGMQSPRGRLTDIEVLASSNPALNSSALQYAAKWKAGPMSSVVEPGATPQSHEVFLTLSYVSR